MTTKIVKILWLDSAGRDEWLSLDEARQLHPMLVGSYGEIINETSDFITIAGTLDAEYGVAHVHCIPRSAIQEIKVVKVQEDVDK